MKKLLFNAVMFGFAFMLFGGCAPSAAHVRKAPPPLKVVKVVTPKPFPNAVHIAGHWTWNKAAGKYTWTKGYWVKRQKGKVWVSGKWVKKPRGYVWVPGHWRKK